MLSIESIKGRTEVMYVLAAVAVLLLAASVVLMYDCSRADNGGGASDTGAREVIPYGTGGNQFIDKEGDAKLIYSFVSYDFDGVKTVEGVKITGLERDPKSSSFTTFPTQITDGTTTYDVIGTEAQKNTGGTFTDDRGIKYKEYSKNKSYVSVSEYSGTDTSIIVPAMITYCEQNEEGTYEIKSKYVASFNCKKFDSISELTIVIPYLSDIGSYDLNQSFIGKTKLTSVKFIVDNDDPTATHQGNVGYVDIGSAFIGCTGLKTLTLPNVLHRADYAFAGCTGLGSSDTDPFIFNTFLRTAEKDYMFTGCTGLKNLVIGKNVNTIENVFGPCTKDSTTYTGCSGIKVVYNASTEITESDIAGTILQSGSYNVLLFDNPGGEFTQWASVTTDATTDPATVTAMTMPEGTWTNGVSIPAWTHKDGNAWYHSGTAYTDCSMTPWKASTMNFDYGYYYFAFTPTCTATYHVYKGGSEIGTTVTQDLLCMYNTLLYDQTTYPDEAARAAMGESSFTWTSLTGETYRSGQSVTPFCDLDLYLWVDDVKPSAVTLTYVWDYINPDTKTVTTYTYDDTTNPFGDYVRVDQTTFTEKAKDDKGNTMDTVVADIYKGKYLASTAVTGQFCKEGITEIYGNNTLAAVLVDNPEGTDTKYIVYNGSSRMYLFLDTINTPVTVNPNTFVNGTKPFMYWTSGVKDNYPGEIAIYSSLSAVWGKAGSDVSVTYNNIEGGSETDPYAYGESTKLRDDFTRIGYKLVGWSYTESGNVNFSLDTPVTMLNNLRLYAVWEDASQPPTVIADSLLISVDDVPAGDYVIDYVFIGPLIDENDTVEYTQIFYDSSETQVAKPTDIGVYTIQVGYRVFRGTVDVTKEYYSGYDENPVTYNCHSGILTIYGGDHSAVTDRGLDK